MSTSQAGPVILGDHFIPLHATSDRGVVSTTEGKLSFSERSTVTADSGSSETMSSVEDTVMPPNTIESNNTESTSCDIFKYSTTTMGNESRENLDLDLDLDMHLSEQEMFMGHDGDDDDDNDDVAGDHGGYHRSDTQDTFNTLDTHESDKNFTYLPKSLLGTRGVAIKSSPEQVDSNKEGYMESGSLLGPCSATSSQATSCSSTNNTPSSSKAVLYSAIGSLENASANSLGKVRSQFNVMSSRDFHRPPATLMPPQSRGNHHSFQQDNPASPEGKKQDATTPKQATLSSTRKHVSIRKPPVDDTIEAKNKETARPRRVKSDEVETTSLNPKDENPPTQSTTTAATESKSKRPRRKLKKVTIDPAAKAARGSKKPVELFRPSSDAYTPRMGKKIIPFKPAEMRTPVQPTSDGMGSLSRPNFRDALRRVAMIIKQHIVKIEERFERADKGGRSTDGLFSTEMLHAFSEDNFATAKYKCTMVRLPMARPGLVYGLRKVQTKYQIPTEQEIYEFGHQLFQSVQLSSECSIVCLIYVERLMEVAMVPLVAQTWRPIFMCGLLLASKVWQDLSSWNIEFASVYPQFALDSINKLELQFLKNIKWDLYISSSLYAKYYFALRSILEKQDFRLRYNRMVGVVDSADAADALKVQKRSEQVKEDVIVHLSRSM